MIPAGMSDFTQVINYDESHEASMRGKERREPFGVELEIWISFCVKGSFSEEMIFEQGIER